MTTPLMQTPGPEPAVAPDVPAAGSGRGSSLRATLRFAAGKLGGAVVSLGLVAVLAFFLFRVMPGDPAKTMLRGLPSNPAQLAQLRHEFGLDQPLWAQFLRYMGEVFQGNLGKSFEYQRPVVDIISERLWPTLLLAGSATALAIVVGLWLGTRSGWRRGSAFDQVSTGIAITLWSVPTFWLGMILLMVFAVGVGPMPGLFPTGGYASPESVGLDRVLDIAHHLVLPCLTMTAVIYAQYLLVMRSSLLDELGNDYLNTARAKGLRDDQVRSRHAVPNALLPTVTLIFLHLGLIISGAITVETVYSWPGLGDLMYKALTVPDLPLLQGTFLVFSGCVIVMNVLADLVYRLLDPRVRAS